MAKNKFFPKHNVVQVVGDQVYILLSHIKKMTFYRISFFIFAVHHEQKRIPVNEHQREQ